jgi:hypothetical protein
VKKKNRDNAVVVTGPDGYPEIPAFDSEAEEAAWWDAHPDVPLKILGQAKRDGTLTHGEILRQLERRKSILISLRMRAEDVTQAKIIADRKGLPYQTYIKTLIREGLRRDEKAS